MQTLEGGKYGKGFTGAASAFVAVAGGNTSHSTYVTAELQLPSLIKFHLQLVFLRADVTSEFVIVNSLYNLPEN